ncbi:MAG: PTS transporter subunit EIIC [Candidatus Eremiobacteraeota bacterium]|nr:PTS transporter subunit EIIC [Candidatus Eremiobacteraeota bacterium]
MVAIREALPWSFSGLILGIIVFFLIAPSPSGISFGAGLLKRIAVSFMPAFGVMSAFLIVLLSDRLARHLHLSRVLLVATSICAFALALPKPYGPTITAYLQKLGASGLFLAIVVALLVSGAFVLSGRLFAYRPSTTSSAQPNSAQDDNTSEIRDDIVDCHPEQGSSRSGDLVVEGRTLANAIAILTVFGIAIALNNANLSLADGIVALLHPLGALGDTYVALMLIVLIETMLWTAGIHGPAVLASVVLPVYLTLQFQNSAAYSAHQPLPHIVVVSLFLFIFPGGAGATLPLVVLLLFSKVKRLRTIARITILPAIINMNEPLLFGLPMVCNPFLSIPFVLAPLVLATITYAAVWLGIVARPAFYIPSSVPTLVSTYLATLDWRAIVLVVINVLVATAIYFPFVRAYERHEATL